VHAMSRLDSPRRVWRAWQGAADKTRQEAGRSMPPSALQSQLRS
jgi:hypothetical protein